MHTYRCFTMATVGLLCLLGGIAVPLQAGEPVTVTIETGQQGPPISPFIYGQFIEHLGRCIYGGIWAEMLEDRKFHFPVTADYDPYKRLTDTPFPVVGASPWQIIGPAEGVTMVAEDSFVGEHTPCIASQCGIRQRDLGIVKGKTYKGYIWLKAVGHQAGPVHVALVWADETEERQTVTLKGISGKYQRYTFTFTAGADTDTAMLEIRNAGNKALLVGTVSLMPGDNVRGMRADTLALLKQLHASMYRWPGGNFVSGYDWRDGIGPRDRRPPRKNPAWTGVEHNDMGLDEFIDFCRELQAEPVIAVNTGFGDAYSAAQEVEYCNGSARTLGGSWRARNGHKKPYQVKYWCVGNEMFGTWQLGFMQLGHYVQKHNLFARSMWDVDPTIQLIGTGNLGGRNPRHDPDQKVEWSEGMLRDCAASMNYISEHFYCGRVPWEPNKPEMDVRAHVAFLRDAIRQRAEGHRKLQGRLGLVAERTVPIAMDEWNYWHRDYVYGELGCVYDLQDALGVAAGLHEYFRNTDIIRMAHYAQTVNVIGCIKTTRTRAFLDATALPLMLYRQHFGSVPVKVTGDPEAQDLDVVGALTEEGRAITIGAVNPNKAPVSIRLDIRGLDVKSTGEQWLVAGDDPRQFNDAQNERLRIQEHDVDVQEGWTLPGYSLGILRLETQ